MKVKEVMSGNVKACDLNSSLADAAGAMWENDCGILPVLKDGNELVGLITDRDICMASAMSDRNPSSISVEEVMTGEVYSVMQEDDMQQALLRMREQKVRRLPVIDAEGKLTGLLSMNDIVLNAKDRDGKKPAEIGYADVVRTYQAICEHRRPQAAAAATAT